MFLAAGTTLGGYRIVSPLGHGGMAQVYRAYQPALDRYVALKVLPAALGQDPAFRERFRREAQTVAALRHPNILIIYDWGEEDGLAYLASELVEGGTLADRLGTPLSLRECLDILRPLASALDYAHKRGVVHRDVKPSNVLLHQDGTPVLSDFGVARMLEGNPQLTSVGVLVGTPAYMAPECLEGGGTGPSVDIYALAVMLYEMLTGFVPYTAETPAAVLLAHREGPLPLPRARNPNLSEAVETVALKALAREPGARFQNAGKLVQAFDQALSGQAPVPEETRAMAAPKVRLPLIRWRRIVLSTATGVLVLVGGVLWWVHHSATVPAVVVDTAAPPPHGQRLFQLGMSRPTANEVVYVGNTQGAHIRFLGNAVQIDAVESATGSALPPFLGLPAVEEGNFVEDVGLQVISGAGAVGLGFHGGPTGEDVVWLSTNDQLVIDRLHAITPADPSTQPVYLYGPKPLQALSTAAGAVDVALAERGGRIAVYLDGRQVATTRDAKLTTGWFDVRSQPFPGSHLTFRITRLEVFAPATQGSSGVPTSLTAAVGS